MHASSALTNDPSLQGWIQERAQAAALGLYGEADINAISDAYSDLLADFREDFSTLVQAVEQLTDGLAQPDVRWDPLSPHLSGIVIRFAAPFPIDVFRRLGAIDEGSVASVFADLSEYLPQTEPYRGHPHVVGVMLLHRGRGLPLQIVDEQQGEHRVRTVRLQPIDAEARGRIPLRSAPAAVSEYFTHVRPT